jgi:cyclopropane fatty-acyl-phospholipid synthase-like methyltransferase
MKAHFLKALGALDPRQLLEYPAVYSSWQKLVRSSNSRPRLVKKFLKIHPGQRVLDIGCGPADVLEHLPKGIDYHGYDINPAYIASARKRYGQRGSFAVRSISVELMDELGTFDVVISLGVVEHLADPLADTLFATARKVLRPGGRLVTLDGAFVKGQHPIAWLLLALDRGGHVRTPETYLAIARRHFPDAKATVLHDLIAVPYTHCIIEACAL